MSDDVIKNARVLYENGLYKKAFDSCSNLLSDKVAISDESRKSDVKEALLLSAYSLMNMTAIPTSDNFDTIYTAISNACNYADSIYEVQEIEEEVCSEYDIWKEKSIKAQLKLLEGNPSFNSWKAYFPLLPEYIKNVMFLKIATRNNNIVDQYCDSEGIDKKEYVNSIKEYQEKFTDEDIKLLEYETAIKIFNRAKIELEENSEVNADYAQVISRQILEHLYLAETIIKHTENNKLLPTVLNERLKTEAEITTFKLNALIYPNGKMMSLLQGNRQADINRLKEIYSKIKETESDFVEPEFPSAEPIEIKQQTGGCYIATAVYGSYDCPQVWTLRRYRDYTLAETWYGRMFIQTYYAVSPIVVKLFGHSEWFKNLWKPKLDRMVKRLTEEGVSDKPYEDKVW